MSCARTSTRTPPGALPIYRRKGCAYLGVLHQALQGVRLARVCDDDGDLQGGVHLDELRAQRLQCLDAAPGNGPADAFGRFALCQVLGSQLPREARGAEQDEVVAPCLDALGRGLVGGRRRFGGKGRRFPLLDGLPANASLGLSVTVGQSQVQRAQRAPRNARRAARCGGKGRGSYGVLPTASERGPGERGRADCNQRSRHLPLRCRGGGSPSLLSAGAG